MLSGWTDRSRSPETLSCLPFLGAGLAGTPKFRSVPWLFPGGVLSILLLSNTENTRGLSAVTCVGSALPEEVGE